MTTFKELISPIIEKSNKKEELLEIVNDTDRIIDGINTEKITTGNGTATVGVGYSYMHDKSSDKQSVCPFDVSLVATDDSTDNEILILLSEGKAKNLIEALQKKLAEIKMLNAYTKPLREM